MAILLIANGFARQTLRVLVVALWLTVCNQNRGRTQASTEPTNPSADLETARSAHDFVNSIGVNVHLNYFDTSYGNFGSVQRELTSIGILHVRDGTHLQSDDYNNTLYDRWVQLGRLGIRFDAVLDPRSKLGTVTPSLLNRINRLSGHTIESFEGPNELDISALPEWPSIDRCFQQALFLSARSMPGDEPIPVVGPSMASASNGLQIGDISDRIDEGNLHPYPAGEIPSMVFPRQVDLARTMSDNKQIVITETGYHNALNDHSDQPAVSESAAAKYIPRLFLEDYARGISRTYLYEFLDEKPDPDLTHCQMHWGLIRFDGSEKPAFTALKNLIAELRDSSTPEHHKQLGWSLNTKTEQTHHLLLERSNGEFDLVLWQEVPSYDCRSQTEIINTPLISVLTLGQEVRSIALYEPSLQAEPLQTLNHVRQVHLQIPDHPLVVKIVTKE